MSLIFFTVSIFRSAYIFLFFKQYLVIYSGAIDPARGFPKLENIFKRVEYNIYIDQCFLQALLRVGSAAVGPPAPPRKKFEK